MKSLSFKTKILLLAVVPLALVSTAITLLSINQTQKLGDKNVDTFSEMFFSLRRAELRNYTSLALSAVKHIYGDTPSDDEEQAQEEAKRIFRNLEFGEDGYIFVNNYEGYSVAHPKKPDLEGKNLWDLQDSTGFYLIQALVKHAQVPGGAHTYYRWEKPSKGREVAKIGYSMGLDRWHWAVGTGLYVDDKVDIPISL